MKTILITGISRGIGCALAHKFLDEGYFVIGTSQNGTIDYTHQNLNIFKLEITSTDSIETCVTNISSLIQNRNSKIDILINNIGTLEDDNETKVIVEKLRTTLEVNLIGTINFTEHTIPHLSNNAHIVNISSQAGSLQDIEVFEHSHAPLRYPAYKISKAALNMYTRTLALRLRHENTNITVSSVHPGWVRTDMGGADAPLTPEEAAAYIYELGISRPETGQFWFKGEKYPW